MGLIYQDLPHAHELIRVQLFVVPDEEQTGDVRVMVELVGAVESWTMQHWLA